MVRIFAKRPCRPGIIALVFFLTVEIGIWSSITSQQGIDFWSLSGDYPTLSLGHALNIDRWLAGSEQRQVGYFQTTHPGIPFQIASWLAYRLAAFSSSYPSDVRGRAQDTIQDPARFLRTTQIMVFLLALGSTVALWRLGSGLGASGSLAVISIFFCYGPSWRFGLFELGNESFALPVGILFFAVGRRAFSPNMQPAVGWWALYGVLGGIALLMKLNYLVWPLAALVGLVIGCSIKWASPRETIRAGGSFITGFLVTVVAIGGCWLTPTGLVSMADAHARVAFHTGLYGTGRVGLVSSQAALSAFTRSAGHFAFLTTLGFALVSMAVVSISYRHDARWLRANLPYATCLASAAGLGFAVALKHYQPQYLIAPAAVLPMMLVWLERTMQPRRRYALAAGVLLAASIGGSEYRTWRVREVTVANQVASDLRTIRMMPLEEGRIRLWSYHVSVPEYIAGFVAETSGVEDYRSMVAQMFPNDRTYNVWNGQVFLNGTWKDPVDSSWKYAIFDRKYYNSQETLPTYFREENARVMQLQATLVVERREAR